ncbi:Glutathione S-transferase N-terminal [Arabidopsis suecica]|nr:Glutathione S-transferase N-terminal [Arabidopsis suecica]
MALSPPKFFVEDRQVPLDATSDPPALFDGTTRLYISYTCPFAQRVWITRNLKGLQDEIKLVPIDLSNRPAWLKEKVNPANKVPALEHNGKITGESLDLIKYVDSNFDGPSLYPEDSAKREFGEELLKYVDETFVKTVFGSFKGDPVKETASAFDHVENALKKFDDGPFFLGELSLVDIAYIPFIERFQVFLDEVFKYEIIIGRPNLAAWIEQMNKMVAYTQTKTDSEYVVNYFKKFM